MTPGEPAERGARGERLALSTLIVVALCVLALNDGGYDIVVRHEVGIVIWWALALAVALGILPRTRPRSAGIVVLVAIAAVISWTAASMLWSPSVDRALVETGRWIVLLGITLGVALAARRSSWADAVAACATAGVGICAVALAGRLSPGLLGADTVERAFEIGRLNQPLSYWNALGAWASITATLCLGLSTSRSRAGRALALACVPLAVTVAYLTYSRAALGGMVLGLAVSFLLTDRRWALLLHATVAAASSIIVLIVVRAEPDVAQGRGSEGVAEVLVALLGAAFACGVAAVVSHAIRADRWRMPPRPGRALAAATLLATAGAVAVVTPTIGADAWEQFKTVRSTEVTADPASRLTNLNGGRYPIWRVAADAFETAPWKGTGAGTFELTWNRQGSAGFVRDAHSLYLETLSELGIFGGVAVLLLLASLVWLAVALRRTADDRGVAAAAAAAVAVFLFGAGIDWLVESTCVAALAAVLIGAMVAGHGRDSAALRPLPRAVAVITAVAMLLVLVPPMVTTSKTRDSQREAAQGDLRTAYADAGDAVDASPWSATGLIQRALIFERAGAYDRALQDLARAERREPEDFRVPLIASRVHARAGDAEAAVRAYRQARALRPNGGFFALAR